MKMKILLLLLIAVDSHALNGRLWGPEVVQCEMEYYNEDRGRSCYQDIRAMEKAGLVLTQGPKGCHFRVTWDDAKCRVTAQKPGDLARAALANPRGHGLTRTLDGEIAQRLGLGDGERVRLELVDLDGVSVLARAADGAFLQFVYSGGVYRVTRYDAALEPERGLSFGEFSPFDSPHAATAAVELPRFAMANERASVIPALRGFLLGL